MICATVQCQDLLPRWIFEQEHTCCTFVWEHLGVQLGQCPCASWGLSRLAWSVTLPSGHQTRPDDRHQKSSGQVLWTPGRGCTPKIPQFSLDLALQILSRHFSLIIWLPPGFGKTQHWFEFDLRNIWLVSPLPKFIRGWLVCLSLWPIRFTTWSLIKAHGQEHVGWSVPF